jgi:hypothetical protein
MAQLGDGGAKEAIAGKHRAARLGWPSAKLIFL